MELLQKRFVSDTVIDYFAMQAEILRRCTDRPIMLSGEVLSGEITMKPYGVTVLSLGELKG